GVGFLHGTHSSKDPYGRVARKPRGLSRPMSFSVASKVMAMRGFLPTLWLHPSDGRDTLIAPFAPAIPLPKSGQLGLGASPRTCAVGSFGREWQSADKGDAARMKYVRRPPCRPKSKTAGGDVVTRHAHDPALRPRLDSCGREGER